MTVKKKTPFDFSSIADLGTYWDGSKKVGNQGGDHHLFNTMGRGDNLQLLYQNLVGRNTDPAGQKYWEKEMDEGRATYQTVADALKASDEYKDQQAWLADNPDATGTDLKNLDSAYVSPFDWGSGSAVSGYDPWSYNLTQEQANAITSDPNSATANYGDQTRHNVGQVVDHAVDLLNKHDWSSGTNPFGGGGSQQQQQQQYQKYDDSALRGLIGGLEGQLSSLRTAFDDYKTQSKSDMESMWNNANWGWGYGSGVGGVRTQNELPGWAPRRGGTSGFFGRGGRAGKGLTTSALNI